MQGKKDLRINPKLLVQVVDSTRLVLSDVVVMVLEQASIDFQLTLTGNGKSYTFNYDDAQEILRDMLPMKVHGRLFFMVKNPLQWQGQ